MYKSDISPDYPFRAWHIFLVCCFCLFLYPISIEGNSVNYSFVLFPILSALLTLKVQRPNDDLLLFMVFYALIFVITSVYQYQLIDEWPRRVVSFFLFMSVFVFMFATVDEQMVSAFKSALIVVSVYFSLSAVYEWYLFGGPSLSFEAKDIVGSQRYGFIYIMGFWLVYLSSPQRRFVWLLKQLALLIVLIGMVLTFSRATIVALLASYIIFVMWSLKNRSDLSVYRVMKTLTVSVLGTVMALYLINTFFPVTFEFFRVRLIERFLDPSIMSDLADFETSEGTRIYLWENTVEFVLRNPLTGSGYLGVWAFPVFSDISGSAHSHYLDVLFRVGILGFLIHMYLLYRTGRSLLIYPGLYWGFIGVLIYGLFHETFKESHGGFVLAFLFAIMSQRTSFYVARNKKRRPLLVR